MFSVDFSLKMNIKILKPIFEIGLWLLEPQKITKEKRWSYHNNCNAPFHRLMLRITFKM